MRCLYASRGTFVIGFTLTNGATRQFMGIDYNDAVGGGAFLDSGVTVSNCVLVDNSADQAGGAAYGGGFALLFFFE